MTTLCFICAVLKLDEELLWHPPHWVVPVGRWGGVVMPFAVVPLWQLTQLVSLAE